MELLTTINSKSVYYTNTIDKRTVFPDEPFIGLLYSDNVQINAAYIRRITAILLTNNCKYICCSGHSYLLESYADEAIVFLMEHDSPFWAPTISDKDLEECLHFALFAASIEQGELKDLVIVDLDNTIRNKLTPLIRRFSSRHYLNTYKAKRRRDRDNKRNGMGRFKDKYFVEKFINYRSNPNNEE